MAKHKEQKVLQRIVVDKTLLLVAVFSLLIIGLVMVYSVTSASLSSEGKNPYSDVLSQTIYAMIGIIGGVLVWRFFPYRIWAGQITWIVWGISIVLLLATYFVGTDINGAKRWLYIGSFGMQPSEFIKVALLLMTIRIVYDLKVNAIEPKAAFAQVIVLIVVPLGFLYFTQSDLGTALICAVGILAVMWIGGIPTRVLATVIALGIAFVVFSIVGSSYRSNRFIYLDPWNDGDGGRGSGYNIIRAYYALAEGGLFGVGIGNSHEKYQYLFASESDFIFAIIGEELGLVGAILVIGLFLLVLYCGLRITAGAPDELGNMIAGGCTIMLVFQAFLNIGCSIGVFPTTGKPLPFISSGGTSLISSLVMIGFILSVERAEEQPKDSREVRRNRENLRIVRYRGDDDGGYDDFGYDDPGYDGYYDSGGLYDDRSYSSTDLGRSRKRRDRFR